MFCLSFSLERTKVLQIMLQWDSRKNMYLIKELSYYFRKIL